jgi:hypothetical protein
MADVIERVAKLRRLATSSNVHEAAAAAAAADRLMTEHGIAEASLEAAGETPAEPVTEASDPIATWARGRMAHWQHQLAYRLTLHYGCEAWQEHRYASVSLRIVGRPSDVASVRYMYSWLVLEIERLAQLHAGNGRTWLNSFRNGAVSGVIGAMQAEQNEVKAAARASGASSALAIVDKRGADAAAALAALHPNLRPGRSHRSNYDGAGYEAGKQAGGRIGLQQKRMAGAGARQLPGGSRD